MTGHRVERLARLLQEEISTLLVKGAKDPRLAGLTLTGVRASPDLSVATVYFAAASDDGARRAQEGLEAAAPFLRRELKRRLRLRRTPELRFERDQALETGAKIDSILREISQGEESNMMERVAEVLRDGKRFVVTSHLNPDGDAIGSMLAAAHLLWANDRVATLVHPEPVPRPYLFLSGVDRIQPSFPSGDVDAIIVLDTGDRQQLPEGFPPSGVEATLVVIDHHKEHGTFGDVVWRSDRGAVGEMVVELARHLGWVVNADFAEAAYTAILTDTGSFRYSSTTGESLRLAAWLVDQGVHPWRVASHVYESWPVERVLLLADVLSTLTVACDGRFASLSVTREVLAKHRATADMTEGFVNYARMVEGAEIAAILRERDDGQSRVSFRSRGRADVAAIAKKIGGGGHHNASGATLPASLEQARETVTKLVLDTLRSLGGGSGDPDFWSSR